jgi:putative phosphoribosyl transferase
MSDDLPSPGPSQAVRFRDRRDAGRRLAELLAPWGGGHSPAVVGIPRGGVPVAAEVALALQAPLDVTVVRKIGAPGNPEYAIGALAEGGVRVFSEQAVRAVELSEGQLHELAERAGEELLRRLAFYRGERAPVPLWGRTAILVDDGLATGRSALAAVRSLRARGAARVVLAAPVGASASVRRLRRHADEVVCLHMPEDLWAVGCWYEDFRPLTDAEVVSVLAAPTGM